MKYAVCLDTDLFLDWSGKSSVPPRFTGLFSLQEATQLMRAHPGAIITRPPVWNAEKKQWDTPTVYTCPDCDGLGEVTFMDHSHCGETNHAFSGCPGGEERTEVCPRCKGEGVVS